ncbi:MULTISPECIES: ABC transporter permease [unclassified Thermosipho (in: thermotogales)]|uniref:ABC transporter permease n=1 Tax=unclassified Thermosipho (in: thermotogales) TaxID=2676525 RepID=UPI000985919C|nr:MULTISPECIES: ABC transporter permease [unclassified Thermosipho (in: thermotogales)]MBT1248558.1 ABC transporter [Thermosipho sp. 1244]OOC47356.1 ABC transporter [Thermosipho sp. 1223]
MINLIKALFLESFRNKISFFFGILLPVVFFIMFAQVFSNEKEVSFAYFSDKPLDIPGKYYSNKDALMKNRYNYAVSAFVESKKIVVYKNYNDYTVDLWIDDLKRKVNTIDFREIVRINERILDYKVLNEKESIYLGSFVLSLVSIGMFSAINLFERYKEIGIIRRFRILPLNAFLFVLSFSLSQFIVSLISFVVVRLVGIFLFNINLKVDYLFFAFSFISAVLGMLGVGILLSISFEKFANSVAQFLYTIFIFFSGIYFPIDFLPKFLKNITYFLPIRYIFDNFKYSIFKQDSFGKFLLQNVSLIIFGVVLLYFGGKILFAPEE